MQKKVIKEPLFEKVQTGYSEKEVWVTSDSKEFSDESSAKHHEFYNIKTKQRGLEDFPISEVTILDLTNLEDLERYIADYCYNTTEFVFNKQELIFPNTYVLYTDFVTGEDFGKDDDWYDYDTVAHCLTLDEWKQKMAQALNNLI